MSVVTETFVGTIDDATATTHTFSGVTIAAGKLAIVRAEINSDADTFSSVTDSAGNTWAIAVQQNSGGDAAAHRSMIAYSVLANALSSGTVTITLSATHPCGASLAYFDSDTGWVAQASVLDKTASQETSNSTAWSSGATATTAQADELLVGVGCHWNVNGSSSTPDAGWTEENELTPTNLAGTHLVSQWQKVTATGAYAASGVWALAEYGPNCIATFMTATGGVTSLETIGIPQTIYAKHIGPF